jgi:hypothetical protein
MQRRFTILPRGLAAVLGAGLALGSGACGSGSGVEEAPPGIDPTKAGMQARCEGRFLPLKKGLKWTYNVTDPDKPGVVETKTQAVEDEEAPPMKPGVSAFRLVTTKGKSANDKTVSWQQIADNTVLRYEEHSFKPGQSTPNLVEVWDPGKLRLDESPEHLKVGATWDRTYKETALPAGAAKDEGPRNETWWVTGLEETVVVGGQPYKNVVIVRRRGTDVGASSDKTYWYACNVGKIKETGGKTEELVKVEGL